MLRFLNKIAKKNQGTISSTILPNRRVIVRCSPFLPPCRLGTHSSDEFQSAPFDSVMPTRGWESPMPPSGQHKGRTSRGGRSSHRHVHQHHATIGRNSFCAPSTLLCYESHVYQVSSHSPAECSTIFLITILPHLRLQIANLCLCFSLLSISRTHALICLTDLTTIYLHVHLSIPNNRSINISSLGVIEHKVARFLFFYLNILGWFHQWWFRWYSRPSKG